MKELTLVRHAKSSWKDSTLGDHERPLNKRGERDAPAMADRLVKRSYVPDFIVSSPAVRALETARIMAKKLGYRRKNIGLEKRIYEAGFPELLDVIRDTDDSVTRLMLFGHNPGLTQLANRLGRRRIESLPTCAVLRLEFDTDRWAEIAGVAVREVFYEYPKG